VKRKLREHESKTLFSFTDVSTFKPGIPHILLFRQAQFVYPDSPVFKRMTNLERARNSIERFLFRKTLKGITLLVVQSRVIRNRVLEYHSDLISPQQIRVIPNTPFPFVPEDEEVMIEAVKYDKPYFIVPTRYYPHKNLELLIDIVKILFRRAFTDVGFLITVTAKDHPKALEFIYAINDPIIQPYFKNLGYVADRHLESLYRSVVGLALPTFLEAQCFSYLEALGFGLPILTSDMDFAREVCGDAAVYLNPFDAVQWADAIQNLLTDSTFLNHLKRMSEKRFQEVNVNPEQVQERYLDLIEEVAS
jgi:glycosyltransferase involved in cell wall biosynthesis